MQRGLNALYNSCLYLSAGLLVLLCLLVLYSIAARLFGFYGGGASDIAGYIMAAASFLALAPTFRANGHICISLITSRLPPALRRRTSIAAHIIMFAATTYLAFYLARLVYFSYRFEERSEGADAILLWLPQLPTAVGATIFALSVLHSGLEVWARPPQKQTAAAHD